MNQIQEFILKLSYTGKFSTKILKPLLEEYSTIENIFKEYSKGNLKGLLLSNLDIGSVYKQLQKYNIQFSCYGDENYPSLLAECIDAPLVIYGVGNFELLNQTSLISIVGTRGVTTYGKRLIEGIIPALNQYCIVSGMAYGVDAYVHKQCIANDVNTIAVLPFSCNEPTPKGNKGIYDKILSSGNLVISEFPPGHKTHNGLFPRRNRIIAGLSAKTVVIEAGYKSGALITAELAFDYNREVYAFPGNKYNPMSKGCNYLIKNNIAHLIEDVSDLGISVSKNTVENLQDLERSIYCAILPEPKSVNELSMILHFEVDEILRICTKLQINGILNTDNQNKFYVS